MIRLINRRLIIPRGDSGSFVLPLIAPVDAEYDEAYFSVLDTLTQEVIIEKQCSITKDGLFVDLMPEDTDVPAGKYYWDIKIYHSPQHDEDGKIVSSEQVDSYYAAYKLPYCVIKEVCDYGRFKE